MALASGSRQRLEALGVPPSQRRQVGTPEIEIAEIPIVELVQFVQGSLVADLPKARPKLLGPNGGPQWPRCRLAALLPAKRRKTDVGFTNSTFMVAAPYSQTRESGSGARRSALGPSARAGQASILQCSIPPGVAHAGELHRTGRSSVEKTQRLCRSGNLYG
jgi:hypothetical protein